MPKGTYHTLTTDLDTGVVVEERFTKNNRLHRDPSEGPAVIYWWPETGAIRGVHYKVNGKRHREDGPATMGWDERGNVFLEEYYFNNLWHREPSEGPAQIHRQFEGDRLTYVSETYQFNGEWYRDPKDGPCAVEWNALTGEIETEDFTPPGQPKPPMPKPLRLRQPVKKAEP